MMQGLIMYRVSLLELAIRGEKNLTGTVISHVCLLCKFIYSTRPQEETTSFKAKNHMNWCLSYITDKA